MNEQKAYQVYSQCNNCYVTDLQIIPFGQVAHAVLMQKECPRCGCVGFLCTRETTEGEGPELSIKSFVRKMVESNDPT